MSLTIGQTASITQRMFGVAIFTDPLVVKGHHMSKKNRSRTHHIVSNPNGGWDVKRGGAERASSHHETKRAAVDQGRRLSRSQETELKNRDGRIAQSDSHGRDPNPPKG